MTKAILIKNNQLTFYILLSGILIGAILYIYSVNAAIRNVVERGNLEEQIAGIQNDLSELEYRYVRFESSVTLESAAPLGLGELDNKIFISRNKTQSLSLNKP